MGIRASVLPASERVEVEAARSMSAAAEDFDESLLLAARPVGGGLAVACGRLPESRELNRAVGVTAVDELDAVEEFFRARGLRFQVSLVPGTSLEPELGRRGYTPSYAWMKFAREPAPVPGGATDLRIETVGADRAGDFADTAARGYGLPDFLVPWLATLPGRPGWTCLVSYARERPVGTGMLYVHGETAWLGLGATLPESRGRGSQSALLARRIALAGELGCSLCVTETGESVPGRPSSSYRNILRAGFREQYLRPNYASPG